MPSERLQKVLAAEGIEGLFPLLKDWSTDDLKALLEDLSEYAKAGDAAIDRAWKKVSLMPEYFFSEVSSRTLDRYRDMRRMELAMATSEICSVVFFYLQERGVDIAAYGGDE